MVHMQAACNIHSSTFKDVAAGDSKMAVQFETMLTSMCCRTAFASMMKPMAQRPTISAAPAHDSSEKASSFDTPFSTAILGVNVATIAC